MGGWFERWRKPAADEARWVVLDVESSGLDPAHDRLLAIAAVALQRKADALAIDLADSFEVVLRQPEAAADKANILVHGIGVGAQRAGVEPAQALRDFDAWAGGSPRFGFHVAFDRVLIERHRRAVGHPVRAARWVDLEPLAALAYPAVRARALDDWLAHFGIPCLQRHHAMADTLATAELLLRLWPRLCSDGAHDSAALARRAADVRWPRR